MENKFIACDSKSTITQFWINPGTQVFNATAFSPLPQPASTINYWIEPTAKPRAGNCDILQAFLLNIICAGSQVTYSYLLRYLAHMLQRPWEKPGIMIVHLGGQGTGKGTFFRILRAIWGRTALQVSDIQEVIGHFNAVLERNFIVFMNEAIFSGDKKALDRLKSLITEPACRVEQKYQPARTIDSYHRFFAASNHDHFARVEQDDRRFVFLRVPDGAKGNHQFFSQLSNAIDDPAVIDALVYELMNCERRSKREPVSGGVTGYRSQAYPEILDWIRRGREDVHRRGPIRQSQACSHGRCHERTRRSKEFRHQPQDRQQDGQSHGTAGLPA